MITCGRCGAAFEEATRDPRTTVIWMETVVSSGLWTCPQCGAVVMPSEVRSRLGTSAAELGIYFEGYGPLPSALHLDQDYPRDSAPEAT